MTTNGENKPLANTTRTKEEKLRILKKQRFELLDEIHAKQQALDRLDYKIHKMKKEKESEDAK